MHWPGPTRPLAAMRSSASFTMPVSEPVTSSPSWVTV